MLRLLWKLEMILRKTFQTSPGHLPLQQMDLDLRNHRILHFRRCWEPRAGRVPQWKRMLRVARHPSLL